MHQFRSSYSGTSCQGQACDDVDNSEHSGFWPRQQAVAAGKHDMYFMRWIWLDEL